MMTAARSALLLGSVAWGVSAGLGLAPGSTWSILSRCTLSQWAFLRVNFLHTEGEVRAGGGQGGAGGQEKKEWACWPRSPVQLEL